MSEAHNIEEVLESIERDERIDSILAQIESGTASISLLSGLSVSEAFFLKRNPKLVAQKLRLCADRIEDLAK